PKSGTVSKLPISHRPTLPPSSSPTMLLAGCHHCYKLTPRFAFTRSPKELGRDSAARKNGTLTSVPPSSSDTTGDTPNGNASCSHHRRTTSATSPSNLGDRINQSVLWGCRAGSRHFSRCAHCTRHVGHRSPIRITHRVIHHRCSDYGLYHWSSNTARRAPVCPGTWVHRRRSRGYRRGGSHPVGQPVVIVHFACHIRRRDGHQYAGALCGNRPGTGRPKRHGRQYRHGRHHHRSGSWPKPH